MLFVFTLFPILASQIQCFPVGDTIIVPILPRSTQVKSYLLDGISIHRKQRCVEEHSGGMASQQVHADIVKRESEREDTESVTDALTPTDRGASGSASTNGSSVSAGGTVSIPGHGSVQVGAGVAPGNSSGNPFLTLNLVNMSISVPVLSQIPSVPSTIFTPESTTTTTSTTVRTTVSPTPTTPPTTPTTTTLPTTETTTTPTATTSTTTAPTTTSTTTTSTTTPPTTTSTTTSPTTISTSATPTTPTTTPSTTPTTTTTTKSPITIKPQPTPIPLSNGTSTSVSASIVVTSAPITLSNPTDSLTNATSSQATVTAGTLPAGTSESLSNSIDTLQLTDSKNETKMYIVITPPNQNRSTEESPNPTSSLLPDWLSKATIPEGTSTSIYNTLQSHYNSMKQSIHSVFHKLEKFPHVAFFW